MNPKDESIFTKKYVLEASRNYVRDVVSEDELCSIIYARDYLTKCDDCRERLATLKAFARKNKKVFARALAYVIKREYKKIKALVEQEEYESAEYKAMDLEACFGEWYAFLPKELLRIRKEFFSLNYKLRSELEKL